MLNKLWFYFFFISFCACLWQTLQGNALVFNQVIDSLFAISQTAVNIAIGLIGLMCFWLGLFNIIEAAGLMAHLSRLLHPLFKVLLPEVPKDHPASAAITMNLAANILGLDNAATPLGIKAMQQLQTLNPRPQVASNAQILFLVLNTSSVTLLPVTIFMFRAQAGAASSTDVFLPILLATSASSFIGLLSVAAFQKLPIYKPVVLLYFAVFAAFISCMVMVIGQLGEAALQYYSSLSANIFLFSFIIGVLSFAYFRHIDVYHQFIEGAKHGFDTAIQLIPYLVAMLAAIALLRSSGVLTMITETIASIVVALGWDSRFVDALPTAMMKPFSGSGSRAMMLESFEYFGVDSLVGRMSSIMQGSTETTFYVLAVYFGAVGIRFGRHAVFCGLLADLAGIIAAIMISYYFFG
ncbi:MAG: hypothetical protein HRU21_00840 [Pseudomonadales bacterium]|nr:hypothetical protein [Pseudomonadales bacterium]